MSTDGLDRVLDRLPDCRVAVIGDFCVDAYWQLREGSSERSIETGLPVRQVAEQTYSLGGAGNVVANLRSLGVGQVRAIGVHGADPFGISLRRMLGELEVDLRGMLDLGSDWQTAVYAKPYSGSTEEHRIDLGSREPMGSEVIDALQEQLHAATSWAPVVVINQQIDGAFTAPAVTEMIDRVISEHPTTCFVVDARRVAAAYDGAVVKLNLDEAAAAARRLGIAPSTRHDATALARDLAAHRGAPVFVTCGERGLLAAESSAVHRALGVAIADEIDPVGAGDTVAATIAAVLAAGGSVAEAASYANLAASVTVRKLRTTGTVTPQELRRAADRPDYVYDPELAENPARARYLPDTEIELVVQDAAPEVPSHVIFDHDGTLSTLRQGWEQVMEPMMVESITGGRAADLDGPTLTRVRSTVREFIDRTTGIQTLVQMQGLVDLIRRFRLVPDDEVLDEHGYKAIYNDRLVAMVERRLDKLASGRLAPEDFHLKNALPLLRALHDHGVTLHLASGTDEHDVVTEANALGFGPYFEERIHGAVGDVTVEAKREVMDRILATPGVDATALATFGDGPVEMRETRKRGGFAIGVCSDERRRFGFNPDKRARLIRGGAHVLIPDYSHLAGVLQLVGLDADVGTRATAGAAS